MAIADFVASMVLEEPAEEEPAEEPEEDGDPELAAAEALNKGGEAEENGDAAMEDGRYDDAVRFSSSSAASAGAAMEAC